MGCYPYRVVCIVGPREGVQPYLDHRFPGAHLTGGTGKGAAWGFDIDKASLIWVEDLKDLGTLAHEAFHATVHMANFLDIQFTDASEEVFAYGIGHIVRTITRELGS